MSLHTESPEGATSARGLSIIVNMPIVLKQQTYDVVAVESMTDGSVIKRHVLSGKGEVYRSDDFCCIQGVLSILPSEDTFRVMAIDSTDFLRFVYFRC